MNRRPHRTWTRGAFVLGVLTLASLRAAAAEERWYVVSMGGQSVGRGYEQTAERDGVLETVSDLQIVLNRLGTRVEVGFSSTQRESREGRLLSAELKTRMSQQESVQRAKIEPGLVRVGTGEGGGEHAREVPYTGELLGPGEIARRSAASLGKEGDRLDFQTWSDEMGRVVQTTRTVLARESLTLGGRELSVLRVEEKTATLPAPRRLWLDARGDLVRAEDESPFGPIRIELADEAAAKRAGSGEELPEEIFTDTLVRTQVRVPHPRQTDRMVVELTHRKPELGWPDFSSPDQRVLEKTEKTVTVEVTRALPTAAATRPVAVTPENREYLEPNAIIQSDDRALARRAEMIVGEERDVLKAGYRLERWVAENMTFDMGIVLAPAAEAYQRRRGTCTSYASLLTAMARAVGIPARFVTGLVYLDGIFGGHAWSEILVGDRWVPLDGAVPADGPADAARIALFRTALAQGVGEISYGAASQLLGQVDARVLETRVRGGETRRFAKDARPYEVAGDLYRNTGLGWVWQKPQGFEFVDLDGVWPGDTLVAIEGPESERVTLKRRERRVWETEETVVERILAEYPAGGEARPATLAGRPARKAAGDDHAVLVQGDGLDVWVLEAEGPEAGKLLERAVAGLSRGIG